MENKKYFMKICAYLPVYNEELRIRYTLESVKWCDQIIVVDKTSTDKTVDIAKSYGADVYIMPNSTVYDASEFDYLKYCHCEWLMIVTASDIIDLTLSIQIKKVISNISLDIDAINVPLARYVLGIYDKHSPWYGTNCTCIYKKKILEINTKGVHNAIKVKTNKIYKICDNGSNRILHLTHSNMDMLMDRHIRYWRAESNNYNHNTMWPAFKDFLQSIITTILKRRTFLLGWNGVALSFAYISYYMMSFLYKWDKKQNKAEDLYKELKDSNYINWKKNQK